MRISRQRIPKSHPNLPAEVYYEAREHARGHFGTYWYVGWGSTPRRAVLALQYQKGFRRRPPE